jgi:hypothetical protein
MSCDYVFYDCSCNGCNHGNASNGPQCAMWHQDVRTLTFWPNNMVPHGNQKWIK